ncbi:MAG TPA: ligase-associated DNA damage response exonuclease [Ignavibacteriaceae bacterium]|nr:ligase-associated DNA damage response exonuclease [Ignavibacteriaceae bacterium]
MSNLICVNKNGLYCPRGDFYIDPWRPVEKAVITHAHSDHARWGSRYYLCTTGSELLLRRRLGEEVSIETVPYHRTKKIKDVSVTLVPAGHMLGSAQIKVEYNGEIVVVSGDYKLDADPTCESFEPVNCNTFISEATFALPIYKWKDPAGVFKEINNWWKENSEAGVTSILYGYSLGKAQRLIAGIDNSIGPVFVHGSVASMNEAYIRSGVRIPELKNLTDTADKAELEKAMVIAPPSASSPGWLRRFKKYRTAFASGWMQIRGNRRRRNVDRGFVISDHADWYDIISTIKETGAENVLLTHGYTDAVVKYLRECGCNAASLKTAYSSEGEEVLEE